MKLISPPRSTVTNGLNFVQCTKLLLLIANFKLIVTPDSKRLWTTFECGGTIVFYNVLNNLFRYQSSIYEYIYVWTKAAKLYKEKSIFYFQPDKNIDQHFHEQVQFVTYVNFVFVKEYWLFHHIDLSWTLVWLIEIQKSIQFILITNRQSKSIIYHSLLDFTWIQKKISLDFFGRQNVELVLPSFELKPK